MAVNPDPKPGRWILPLVVLGMIAFTYFFVRELPEASTDTTLVSGGGTTTTLGPDNGSSTTVDGGGTALDPAVQDYLDAIDAINQELQVQRTELVTVNSGFDADPREIEYSEAVDRFEAVQTATQELADRHSSLTPPESLADNHQMLLTAVELAADSITQALEGLQSTDTGQQRTSAVDAYTTAASDYDTEVTNAHNAAGATQNG